MTRADAVRAREADILNEIAQRFGPMAVPEALPFLTRYLVRMLAENQVSAEELRLRIEALERR